MAHKPRVPLVPGKGTTGSNWDAIEHKWLGAQNRVQQSYELHPEPREASTSFGGGRGGKLGEFSPNIGKVSPNRAPGASGDNLIIRGRASGKPP
jgi:hypothetical protein